MDTAYAKNIMVCSAVGRDVRGKKMFNIEERIAKVSELEAVAINPANDAITRKIASDRIINLRLLIQSQQR
ncbi:MAG: hypothetical protein LUQ47_05380 [Methanotrichaceae archaeon]|nr:hypothetical protein [Methanotrichaceae archaeon]